MRSLINDDCLNFLPQIKDNSVDMIVSDLPFEMTANSWDKIIPINPMFKELNRIIKPNGVIALMSAGLYTAELMIKNKKYYRYTLEWKTKEKTNFLNSNRMPLRQHIDIPIFYKKLPKYNPQKTYGHKPINNYTKHSSDGSNYGKTLIGISGGGSTERYPTSIIDIPYKTISNQERIHPTQKPVEIYEYLIKTYTDKGDLVVDISAGALTLAIAAFNLDRDYICIEKDKDFFEKGKLRVEEHIDYGYQMRMFQ